MGPQNYMEPFITLIGSTTTLTITRAYRTCPHAPAALQLTIVDHADVANTPKAATKT
jgi:hypothetical protein